MKSRSHSQHGFVLLLTLIILALVAVVMVDVSRRSVGHAAAAIEAERDLQRRWGAASAREAVMPRIVTILSEEQERRGEPVTELAVSLELGGQGFDLVVADEQAKANLNDLYRERGLDALTRVASETVGVDVQGLRVALSPDSRFTRGTGSDPESDTPDVPAFESWSQVFGQTPPDVLLRVDEEGWRPVADLTCWGDGRLNINRASRQAIAIHAGDLLSTRDRNRLIELRQAQIDAAADVSLEPESKSEPQSDSDAEQGNNLKAFLLETMDFTDRQREAFDESWVDESRSQSLAILVDDDGRRYRELAIATIMEKPSHEDAPEPEEAAAGDADAPTPEEAPEEASEDKEFETIVRRWVW